MKHPKLSRMTIDKKGTKMIRSMSSQTKKVKITINIDFDSLETLK